MFHEAMLVAGTDKTKALLMYEAVFMFGPKWTLTKTIPNILLSARADVISEIRRTQQLSDLSDLKVTERNRGNTDTGEAKVDLGIQIAPPAPQKFTIDDFVHYQQVIEQQEAANPGSVTLSPDSKL